MTPEFTAERRQQIVDYLRDNLAHANRDFLAGVLIDAGVEDRFLTAKQIAEILGIVKPAKAAKDKKKRVKALPVKVNPKGAEIWYVIPSDPDYAVSNRLGVARLTATKRNPPGTRLAPRLRYYKGQYHAYYRLFRNGKAMDLNVAFLLSNALRKGKTLAEARVRPTEKPTESTQSVSAYVAGTSEVCRAGSAN
jgi:hypothetical protein